jgi:hypothetical protein
MRRRRALLHAAAGLFILLGSTWVAAQDMQHEGSVQALLSEREIPMPRLNYNHEGTSEALPDGRVIALWQSSNEEGLGWGWAMRSVWDGTSWTRPRLIDLPNNVSFRQACVNP